MSTIHMCMSRHPSFTLSVFNLFCFAYLFQEQEQVLVTVKWNVKKYIWDEARVLLKIKLTTNYAYLLVYK